MNDIELLLENERLRTWRPMYIGEFTTDAIDAAEDGRAAALEDVAKLEERVQILEGGVAMVIKVKRLMLEAELPSYATDGSAGLDLRAAIDAYVTLYTGQRKLIPTGLAIELPVGHEGQIRPRSGMASKYGVTVFNAPGTIDEDYRGEISVLLINLGAVAYHVKPGERIAQLVIAPVTRCEVQEVDALDDTMRGAGGFGSTGR